MKLLRIKDLHTHGLNQKKKKKKIHDKDIDKLLDI